MSLSRQWAGWTALAALAVTVPVAVQWWQSTRRVPVDVAVVGPDSIHLTFTGIGTLIPAVEADVGTRVTGTLVDLTVTEGSTVRAGAVIGHVAPDGGVSTRLAARSAAMDAEGRVLAARVVLDGAERRARRLHAIADEARGDSLVSAQDVEAAAEAVALAKSNLRSAESAKISAEALLAEAANADQRVLLVAPFDGVVTRVYKRPGETVVPATYGGEAGRVLTIAQPRRGKVVLNVPERYALRLDARDAIQASLLVDETRTLRMHLSKVRPRRVSDGQIGEFEAELVVEPDGLAVPWGASVLVRVSVVAGLGARVVPLSALVPDPSASMALGVFAVRSDTINFIPVVVAQFGDVTADLASGPAAGTTVVFAPTDEDGKVRNGAAVRIRDTLPVNTQHRTRP